MSDIVVPSGSITPNRNEVPQPFAQHLRDALAHLYDTAHLQRHPLLSYLVPSDISEARARAQYLREALLQAIADLRPPAGVSPHDPSYRPYAILRGKYVEGKRSEELQMQLAIGRRQYFREQQRALDSLAILLWDKCLDRGEARADSDSYALEDELQQLGVKSEAFAAEPALQQALRVSKGLALARGVGLSLTVEGAPQVFADEAITQQLLISLVGLLVQQSANCYIEATLSSDGPWVAVNFTGMVPVAEAGAIEVSLLTPKRLAAHLGGQLSVGGEPSKPRICLRLPSARENVVAIIDDNPKTLHLFQRYLEPYRYHPVLIQKSEIALSEIRALQPDAVVLDIMMRDVDGWQVLQGLRTDPATRHIPVLVCSVLNDSELAYSLGAVGYLRKPVSQAQLVRALDQACRAQGAERGRPSTPSPTSG